MRPASNDAERGRKIRSTREALRWSRIRLARAIGISRDALYRLENGKMGFRQQLVDDIATALGVTLEELIAPPPGANGSGSSGRARFRKRADPAPVQVADEQVEIPVVVAQLLMSGRLGSVSARELEQLIRNSHDLAFAGDMNLLELECLWRRACGSMHIAEHKRAVDAAFDRIKRELEELVS